MDLLPLSSAQIITASGLLAILFAKYVQPHSRLILQ